MVLDMTNLKDATKIFRIRMTLRPRVVVPGLSVTVAWTSHPDDSLDITDWRKSWAKNTGNVVDRLTAPC